MGSYSRVFVDHSFSIEVYISVLDSSYFLHDLKNLYLCILFCSASTVIGGASMGASWSKLTKGKSN